MAQTTRQTNLLVQQDWTKIYQTFTNADFTSYDFETLRNSMITYLKTYYPETFNDFLESSEYLALIDMIAFLGQSLAFRADLNARENFIDTAQRRDSILKLARMLSYNPQRNTGASGLIKIESVRTTESVADSSGINLSNATIHWNDLTNENYLEQFNLVLNSALISGQAVGKPANSQVVSGIRTDEYTIALDTNTLPVAPFSTTIQGSTVAFEAVSATTLGQNYIYEADPTRVGAFNILYRNDNNGNSSNNTGFFLYFKQGKLNATEFDIVNAIPNNFVTIATNNINNTDAWLYSLDVNRNINESWTKVPALGGINVIYNQLSQKNLYQINTRTNDQVDLVFGDGNFSNIPRGGFRFLYRTSNGTTYSLTPDDIASVSVVFPYISKKNRIESLTITASLNYTVTNANAAPSLGSIKASAPQQYYTQNRMITAEDYNSFPSSTFGSIQKIKAVNRTSSGVSMYLDTLDPTASFSSTNIFGDDGIISANTQISSTQFDFLTDNDIFSALFDDIIPLSNTVGVRNYYYGNVSVFPRLSGNTSTVAGGNVKFVQNTASTNSSTGFLANLVSNVTLQVGSSVNHNLRYVDAGAILQFSAPAGFRFDSQHQLQPGNALINAGDTLNFFAVVTDRTSESNFSLGTSVPTGAVLSDIELQGANAVIPTYKNDFSSSLVSTLITQIKTFLDFGLKYNTQQRTVNADGTLGTYGVWENIDPQNISASTDWLIKFVYNQGIYEVYYKNIEYIFESVNNTKFYFDPRTRVYNSSLGINITDSIKVLKINSKPTDSSSLDRDLTWQIYNTITAADGYVEQSRVLVKSPATQVEMIPDNPDLYQQIAGNQDNRPSLYFQYKHNVPTRSRVDPTPVNIIDVYILTATYANDFQKYLRDTTGAVARPALPAQTSLETAYGTLDNFKAVSDSLIYNPAQFKMLFGSKADASLQARFQVVKNPAANITDNEVKSRVINAINRYFDVSNWDFGETFYFSELAAYLHAELVPNISSVVISPANTNLVFGNYFQINCEPYEIITSAATINDIEIISAVTAAQLNLGNPLIGTY